MQNIFVGIDPQLKKSPITNQKRNIYPTPSISENENINENIPEDLDDCSEYNEDRKETLEHFVGTRQEIEKPAIKTWWPKPLDIRPELFQEHHRRDDPDEDREGNHRIEEASSLQNGNYTSNNQRQCVSAPKDNYPGCGGSYLEDRTKSTQDYIRQTSSDVRQDSPVSDHSRESSEDLEEAPLVIDLKPTG